MKTKIQINKLAYEIVACAIEVHRNLGPGLLESIYEACLIEELQQKNIGVNSQINIQIVYKGKRLPKYLKLDLLVNDLIIVQLKSVDSIIPVYKAQLLSYLKLTGKPKGLIINFNVEKLVTGVVSLVTQEYANLKES